MSFKILYVEDEQILGQLVRDTLRNKGYDVHHISNGADGLNAYHTYRPHLCLLDVMLPGADGFTIAKQIRAADANIPILFLTAKVQTADVVEGFNAGCNDYIRKPFSIEELLMRIQTWLSEKYATAPAEDEAVCKIGTFTFHPQKQVLETPKGNISLTFKEAQLLHTLYKHRNTIIQRDYLMQQVWGVDSMYNSRSLDVYVNRLRKYFADTPNQIITLKSIGYRFICA